MTGSPQGRDRPTASRLHRDTARHREPAAGKANRGCGEPPAKPPHRLEAWRSRRPAFSIARLLSRQPSSADKSRRRRALVRRLGGNVMQHASVRAAEQRERKTRRRSNAAPTRPARRITPRPASSRERPWPSSSGCDRLLIGRANWSRTSPGGKPRPGRRSPITRRLPPPG
jgi:hypothetical protein